MSDSSDQLAGESRAKPSSEEAVLIVRCPTEWATARVSVMCFPDTFHFADVPFSLEQPVAMQTLEGRRVYAAIFPPIKFRRDPSKERLEAWRERFHPELESLINYTVYLTVISDIPLPGLPDTRCFAGPCELSLGGVTEINATELKPFVDGGEDEEEVVSEELEIASLSDYSPTPATPVSPAPADVVLGTDLDSGKPVALPYQTRDLGVTVLGQTGYGKTTLLEHLILKDIEQGTSIIAIDAHGDLTRRILSLATTSDENLLLLEAWEDAPFRLNLFECPDPTSTIAVDRAVSGVVQVFKRLFGSPREYYPRLERDLGNAARTVIANRGTLLDVPRLFWDTDFRVAALAGVTNRHVREFWALWERIGRTDRQMEQLESTINRLDQFLGSEFVAQLVGSTITTIPFDEVLGGNGRVLLLSLPVGEIGEGLCNLIGSLFLAVLTERIFARARLAPAQRPRVHLYLDEYGRYATPTTAQLLTEGRKFGVGTTIAHQTRAQIPDEENRAAELQVGTLLCFQLIGADAVELSGEFQITPEPQWEEPVEEIEGEEPELAIPPDPVEHLLKSGHPDPLVRETVRTFLKPRFDPGYRTIDDRTNTIPTALADAMEQRITDTPHATLQALCSYWTGYARVFLPDLRDCTRAEIGMQVWSKISSKLQAGTLDLSEKSQWKEDAWWKARTLHCVKDFIKAADAIVVAGGDPTGGPHEAKLTAELEKIFAWYRPHRPEKDPVTGERNLYKEWYNEETQEWEWKEPWGGPQQWLTNFLESLSKFVYPMLILLHRLADEPLLVPTGRVRPRKRIRYITHPQRSYQDVQNELAVELASLPRFTAYCNVQGEQYRVALSEPAAGGLDEKRIESIRRESRRRFGRPLDEGTPETPPTPGPPQPPSIRRHLPDEH